MYSFVDVKVKFVEEMKKFLLKTFTTRSELGWILRYYWFVNVPMIILAVIIKCGTCINWRIVMLKALKGILRNPKTERHNKQL